MATTLTAPAKPLRASVRKRYPRAWLVLATAHLPLLLFHAQSLWARSHYEFFPFVLVGAFILAWRNWRDRDYWQTGSVNVCRWSLAACSLFYGAAVLLRSPWLGAISALWTLALAGYALGGSALLRAMAPAWALLWLAIPPPLAMDERLIQALQPLTVRLSSPVLDALGIDHLPAGNVIELPGRVLFIEEACSGVRSLFAVVACAVFYVLWARKRVMPALLLLVAAVGWVVLANVLRVVIVTCGLAFWNIDMTTGWRHELLGLTTFAIAVGLILSTDCLIRFFFEAAPLEETPMLDDPDPEPVVVESKPVRPLTPLLDAMWRPHWPVVTLFVVLGIGQCSWFVNRLAMGAESKAALTARLKKLDAELLPENTGMFTNRTYRLERRGAHENNGEQSHLWLYDFGRHKAVVAVDFPFMDWHELTICYQFLGWNLESRQLDVETGQVVDASLTKSNGRRGQLAFGLTDAAGKRQLAPHLTFRGRLQRRLAALLEFDVWITGPPDRGFMPTYQVQLFIEAEGTLTQAELQTARSFFDEARRRIEAAVHNSEARP